MVQDELLFEVILALVDAVAVYYVVVAPYAAILAVYAAVDVVSFRDVVAAADAALLEAKAAGRDVVVLAPSRHDVVDPDSSIRALPIRPPGASTAV